MININTSDVLEVVKRGSVTSELPIFFEQWYFHCASKEEVPNLFDLYSGDSNYFSMAAYSLLIADLLKEQNGGLEVDIYTDWDSVEDLINYYTSHYQTSNLSNILRNRLIQITLSKGFFVLDSEEYKEPTNAINIPFESVW